MGLTLNCGLTPSCGGGGGGEGRKEGKKEGRKKGRVQHGKARRGRKESEVVCRTHCPDMRASKMDR